MALNNVITRSISGTSVFNVSIVEETEPKDYQNRFFMFIKGVPGIRSETSPTGRTYDMNSAITFKVEAEKALAMSYALLQMASGKGKAYEEMFGPYTIFADMSKSNYGSGGKKSLNVRMGQNNKDGKAIVNIYLTHDNTKVAINMSAYEAYGASKMLEFLALKCMEFELKSPGMVVKNQNGFQQKKQYNNNRQLYEQQQHQNTQEMYSPPPKQNFSSPSFEPNEPPRFGQNSVYRPTPTDSQNINQVSNSFSNVFDAGDDPFGI